MPPNNRLRLYENQCPPPAIPKPLQNQPEQFVSDTKARLGILLLENTELLPKRQVFQE